MTKGCNHHLPRGRGGSRRRLPPGPSRAEFTGWLLLALAAVGHGGMLQHDPLAEAITRAWMLYLNNPRYFVTAEHLTRWLLRTARWKRLEELRKFGHRVTSLDNVAECADPRSRPSDSRWTEDDLQALRTCLAQLEPDDRLILLGFAEGMTDCEVAGILFGDGSSSAGLRVWRRRHKALGRLRDLAEQCGLGK